MRTHDERANDFNSNDFIILYNVKMRRYQICECQDSVNDSNTAVITASTRV